jgi:Protein of unknown function (DUF3828)
MRLSLSTRTQLNTVTGLHLAHRRQPAKLSAAFFICMLFAKSCLGQISDSAQTPELFVRTLIQHAQRASRADEEAQAGLRRAGAIYTSGLIALMRKDRNSTPRGDVGNLDFDPICNCQDSEGMQLVTLVVISATSTHASVVATLKFSEPQPVTVQYFLLRTATGWRIDDIKTSDIPSLRKFLQQGH